MTIKTLLLVFIVFLTCNVNMNESSFAFLGSILNAPRHLEDELVGFVGQATEQCEKYGNMKAARKQLTESIESKIPKELVNMKMTRDLMRKVSDLCNLIFVLKQKHEYWQSHIPQIIMPGTKWCGPGDIAKDYNDLGYFRELDSCCRQHDHCLEFIEAGHTDYNITNKGLFTISACNCDQKFHECLCNARKLEADLAGHIYFNIIALPCLKNDFPIFKCLEYNRFVNEDRFGFLIPFNELRTYVLKVCQEYQLNESAPKKYQLFGKNMYKPCATLF